LKLTAAFMSPASRNEALVAAWRIVLLFLGDFFSWSTQMICVTQLLVGFEPQPPSQQEDATDTDTTPA
jgi:hypothetical protein